MRPLRPRGWISLFALLLLCGCSTKSVELPDNPTDGPQQPPTSGRAPAAPDAGE